MRKSPKALLLYTCTILFLMLFQASSLQAKVTPQWDIIELKFIAEKQVHEPFDLDLWVNFRHEAGVKARIPGFYNGDNTWVVRFCPDLEGNWTYTSSSDCSDLAGKKGSFEVTKTNNKGPIVIPESNPQTFAYANGDPYFVMAFELDWLFALDAENHKDIPLSRSLINDVANNGFNQIVMNVFAYDANWGEREKAAPEHRFDQPKVYPFGGNNENPDHSTLNIEYFKRLDRVVELLNEKEMVCHLMIYVWNKKVNWPEPESKNDNRYFDYIVKRYQAYPNLIWDISKEALAYGRDDMGYISRRIHRLRKLDGHDRLLTVHDYNYCNAHPDLVDFISIQEWESYLYYRMVNVRKKHSSEPIFNIEHGGYEKTTYSIFDGAYTDPIACLDRNYQCVFAGVYSTYYWQNTSWYNVITAPFGLPEDQQPHFHYYKHLVEFFEHYNYNELKPKQNAFSPPYLTNDEDLFLFYLSGKRKGLMGALPALKGKQTKVSWYDPLTGQTYDQGMWDFTNGTWLGIEKPDELSGDLGIAILEVME